MVKAVNMHEAKTHLSRLVDRAAKGEPFIIARAGKPLVKVIAVDWPSPAKIQRIGFMQGEIKVPEDFNDMGQHQIESMFGIAE